MYICISRSVCSVTMHVSPLATALQAACLSGNVKAVEEMLDKIPSVIDECLPNDDPLIVA